MGFVHPSFFSKGRLVRGNLGNSVVWGRVSHRFELLQLQKTTQTGRQLPDVTRGRLTQSAENVLFFSSSSSSSTCAIGLLVGWLVGRSVGRSGGWVGGWVGGLGGLFVCCRFR